jgi:hypothetical protein
MKIDDGNEKSRRLEELVVVVDAATAFRRLFDCSLRQIYNKTLNAELWQNSLYSVPDRMISCYDEFNFDQKIEDIEIRDLKARLESIDDYNDLKINLFLIIINELSQVMIVEVSDLVSIKLNSKALIANALEMINLHERILIDLIVLLIFVNTKINTKTEREKNFVVNLDAVKIYIILLEKLRKYRLMQ